MSDDEGFAYFLPSGIEDDPEEFAEDAGYGFNTDDDAGEHAAGTTRETRGLSISSAGSEGSTGSAATTPGFGSYGRVTAPVPSWQANATQPVHTSASQQAALLSLLQQQSQHARLAPLSSPYGSTSGSGSDQLLGSYYSQPSGSVGSPAYSPTHAGMGAPAPSPSPEVTANLNSQQMQFFQQLQLYQQQLLMQQQQQQQQQHAMASSHYTKAPVSYYDEAPLEDEQLVDALPGVSMEHVQQPQSPPLQPQQPPPQQQQQQLQQQSAGAGGIRRRPLPHNASADAGAAKGVVDSSQQLPSPSSAPVQPTTKSTVPSSASVSSASTWGAAHSASSSGGVLQSSSSSSFGRQQRQAVTVVVASTKTENWPKATTVAAAAAAPVAKSQKSDERAVAKAGLKEEQRKAAQAAAKAAAAAAKSSKPAAVAQPDQSKPHRKHSAGSGGLVLVQGGVKPHKVSIPGPPVLNSGNEFDLLADNESDNESATSSPVAASETSSVAAATATAPAGIAVAPLNKESHAPVRNKRERRKARRAAEDADAWPSAESEAAREEIDEAAEEAAALAAVAAAEAAEAAAASKSAASNEGAAGATETKSAPSTSIPLFAPSPSPPLSPTTGLPVSPILRRPDAPASQGHSRHVSFYQPPSKKQLALAAQRAKEQAAATSATTEPATAAADGVAGSSATVAEGEAEGAQAGYPVESVSGVLNKRDKKKGKLTVAVTAPAKPAPKPEESVPEPPLPAAEVEVPLLLRPSAPPAPADPTFLSRVRHAYLRGEDAVAAFIWKHAHVWFLSLLYMSPYIIAAQASAIWTCVSSVFRVHKHAATVLRSDHQLAFCFTFLYLFPFLVRHMTYWAPPWAAPCLWYAFLMQVLCTHSPSAHSPTTEGDSSKSNRTPLLVSVSRVVLPLLFLTEGVSHHTLLLQLNGSERLVLAFLLGSVRTAEYCRPLFLAALSGQVLLTLLTPLGPSVVTQWTLLLFSLMVMHEPEDALLRLNTTPLQKVREAMQYAGPWPGTQVWAPEAAPPAAPASAAAATTTAVAPAPAASGWLSTLLGISGMSGAFARRPRTKPYSLVSLQKVRRAGRL